MWPFKRKKWEELGTGWTSAGVESTLYSLTKCDDIHLRDISYRALPLDAFQTLMWNCRPMTPEAYRKQIFDCDDHACCFEADMRREWAKRSNGEEALCFGYISAKVLTADGELQHAFIWMLDDVGMIHYIEPQTNRMMEWKIISITELWG